MENSHLNDIQKLQQEIDILNGNKFHKVTQDDGGKTEYAMSEGENAKLIANLKKRIGVLKNIKGYKLSNQTLENILTQGVGIDGTMSVKLVNGKPIVVEQAINFKLPILFKSEGKVITVAWEYRSNSLIAIDEFGIKQLVKDGTFQEAICL